MVSCVSVQCTYQHHSKMYFCSFKQIQSWVEGPCWWYLCWSGLALTPADIMVQQKMSCQLMEELPVAAGRSVVAGAHVLTSSLVTFFCVSPFCLSLHPPLSFYLHLFLFLFLPLSPPDSTPSTSTPWWQITPGGWFVGCQKCSLCWHEGRASGKRGWIFRCSSPRLTSPHVQRVLTATRRWGVSVEIDISPRAISFDYLLSMFNQLTH